MQEKEIDLALELKKDISECHKINFLWHFFVWRFMAKSILTKDMSRCVICGRPKEAVHHVFGGPNRKNSEKYGLKIPLCNSCHNMSPESIHFNRELDLTIKRKAQKIFESKYSHELFMEVFGKNYL